VKKAEWKNHLYTTCSRPSWWQVYNSHNTIGTERRGRWQEQAMRRNSWSDHRDSMRDTETCTQHTVPLLHCLTHTSNDVRADSRRKITKNNHLKNSFDYNSARKAHTDWQLVTAWLRHVTEYSITRRCWKKLLHVNEITISTGNLGLMVCTKFFLP